jgi:hypothetical protein
MLIMKKNLKRALSLLLAATMTLSMSAISAFADENSASTEASTEGSTEATTITELPVAKCIKIKEGTAIPQETFTFKMTPATSKDINDDLTRYDTKIDDTVSGQKVQPGVALGTYTSGEDTVNCDTVTYSFNSSDTAHVTTAQGATLGTYTKNNKKFDLTHADFKNTGIYRYYITETAVENPEPYISYSKDKYIVDLYVFNGPTVNNKATFEVKGATVYKITPTTQEDGTVVDVVDVVKPTDITFTNTINTNLLTISKTVVGEEYTKDEQFNFWIKIPTGGDTITLAQGTKISAQIYNSNGLVNDSRSDENGFLKLEVNGEKLEKDGGKETYTSVTTDGTPFQLKSGEELRIYAPITMIYYVVEADYSNEGYTQTYTYYEAGTKQSTTFGNNTADDETKNAKAVVVKGTVNTIANTVAYTNSRNITLPETGINLDVVPYILLTLIAVCGGILFISRKKRVNQ